MDRIFLHDLRIETVIGVYPWERNMRQIVVLDIDMGTEAHKAAATDCIDDALDYKAVAKRVRQFVENSAFNLVETLAEQCAKIILHEFHVPWVQIKVNKIGAITGAKDVGVIIERNKQDMPHA